MLWFRADLGPFLLDSGEKIYVSISVADGRVDAHDYYAGSVIIINPGNSW